MKLGLSLTDTGEMKDLVEALVADTGIKEMLLLEIDGEGFHRTFSGKNKLNLSYSYGVIVIIHLDFCFV